MKYLTTHLDSFTKRIAEAINGRQIGAKASKPSTSKTLGIGKVHLQQTVQSKFVNLQG